jgi:hypothetical protein
MGAVAEYLLDKYEDVFEAAHDLSTDSDWEDAFYPEDFLQEIALDLVSENESGVFERGYAFIDLESPEVILDYFVSVTLERDW